MARTSGFGRVVLAAVIALPGAAAAEWKSPQLDATLSAGFDSNPAQRADGPGLGFAQLALGLLQQLPAGLSLENDLWWRDYAGDNDSGRLDIRGVFSRNVGDAQIDLWAAAGWYRDRLVVTDERNETAVAARYRRTLNARFDMALFVERRWLAFLHPSRPWAGRPGGVSPGLNGQTPGSPQTRSWPTVTGERAAGRDRGRHRRFSTQRRSDRLDQVALEASWFAAPNVSLTLALESAWRQSSITLDAYAQRGVWGALSLDPSPAWSLQVEAGWSRFDYTQAPRNLARVDAQRWAGLELRRWLSDSAVFCTLDAVDSRSTIAAEAFSQWVSACGWQHRF